MTYVHDVQCTSFNASKMLPDCSWRSPSNLLNVLINVYNIADFGDDALQVLAGTFNNKLTGAGVVLDDIDPEWQMLKECLFKR